MIHSVPRTHNMAKMFRKLLAFRHHMFQFPRFIKYRILSNSHVLRGNPRIIQPVLFLGRGEVNIGKNVTLGVGPSPFLYNGYIHIEARKPNSRILIGNHVWMNNCVLLSEGEGIEIGDRTLLGSHVEGVQFTDVG